MQSQYETAMLRTNILSLQEVASVWIPYRIEAVRAAAWAMNLQTCINGDATINLSIDKELRFSGYVNYFIEPMIEIGLVHARALLEFLGIYARNGKLINIGRRRPSDIAIEHYSAGGSNLSMVSPEEICSHINMPDSVVEWALVGIIEKTNKWLAHVTTGEMLNMAMHGQLACALEQLPSMIDIYFYDRLDTKIITDHGFDRWTAIDNEKAGPMV
jgi:hypothetical protein